MGFEIGCKYIGSEDWYCGTVIVGTRGAMADGNLTSLASKSKYPNIFWSLARLSASEDFEDISNISSKIKATCPV